MNWVHFIAVFLVLGQGVFAQISKTPASDGNTSMAWEPPPAIEVPSDQAATVPNEMVPVLHVGGLAVILEKTEMNYVQKRLGGIVGRRGDAGDSLEWLCFQGTGASGRWLLWLESGEIHGGTVGGFLLRPIAQREIVDKRCKSLPNSSSGIQLPLGLHLGMTEAEAIKAVGKPTIRVGEKLFFLHEHQQSIQNQSYTSMNTVTIVLRSGVVAAIEVWKTTTS